MMYRFYSKPEKDSAKKNSTKKSKSQTPRVAVVGELKDGILRIAVSRCSKKDSFFRKRGREIAEGRLLRNKIYREIQGLTSLSSEEFIKIATEIANEVKNRPENVNYHEVLPETVSQETN